MTYYVWADSSDNTAILYRHYLRKGLQFLYADGWVVSDYSSVEELKAHAAKSGGIYIYEVKN